MAEAKGPDSGDQSLDSTRQLGPVFDWWMIVIGGLTTLLSINYLFNLQFFIGFVMVESTYYFTMTILLLPLVFMKWRGAPGERVDRIPLRDWAIIAVTVGICLYMMYYSLPILEEGWEYIAPDHGKYVAVVFWLIVLEACRRTGGWSLFVIVLLVSLFPIYTEFLPGTLRGQEQTFLDTAAFHIYSTESAFGIPMRAFVDLVIGFLIFGVALQYTGGGKFFINLAFALLGHVRGGPAKVAIFASGLMGSMSGSVVTNVLTTGVMSIPAMRKVGFSRAYAGGVETCASTGGVLMPPIMGITAFVMAEFLGVPYEDIVVAAAVPSALYFFGLFMQIDAYSARQELPGLDRSELPSVRQTLKEGWYYIAAFGLLIYMLLVLKREAYAPYYATAALIVLNQVFPHNRWGWAELKGFIAGIARMLAELTGILLGVGLIAGALSMTGMIGPIANELVHLAGGSVLILLLMGALTSFILGIGMTVTAAYIFLAITLAPALERGGLDPMAVHLFILYWGMLSFITPPVALGAFAAATIARAKPMETGLKAMQLGSIIYFIPFFFVLNPALILKGDTTDIVVVCVSAFAGVVLVAGGIQGYLVGVGNLARNAMFNWPIRVGIILSGILLVTPGGGEIPFSHGQLLIAALVIGVPSVLFGLVFERRHRAMA